MAAPRALSKRMHPTAAGHWHPAAASDARSLCATAVLTRGTFLMDENRDDIILKGGVRIVTLPSWQQFHQKADGLKSKRGYVWRGQKKDETGSWSLQSSFDRKVQSKNQSDRIKKLNTI